jgi:hypothetical protein
VEARFDEERVDEVGRGQLRFAYEPTHRLGGTKPAMAGELSEFHTPEV